MSEDQGAAIGGSIEQQIAMAQARILGHAPPNPSHDEKQYAEEMSWRRDQDGRQTRAAALEAAIRVVGERHDVDAVMKAAASFEGYLNGLVSLPATGAA